MTLRSLKYVDFSGNNFSGPLPSELGLLTQLQTLYLDNNRFSSSLPSRIGNLPFLQTLDLSFNQFQFSVPSTFILLSSLNSLYLQNNRFTGKLSNFLSSQSNLITLDVSNNLFTGELGPISLFKSSNLTLQGIAAVKNCLSLSEDVLLALCDCKRLRTVALDGLHSSSGCISMRSPLARQISRKIPRCLFDSLPYLTSLNSQEMV